MPTLDEIKKAAKEGVDEALGEFRIEREQHYEDHRFIKGVRDGIKTARRGSFWTLGVAAVGAIIWALKTWIAGTPH